MNKIISKIVFILTFLVSGNASAEEPTLNTVPFVDLDRYLGRWHEIVRIDHGFQAGCTDSVAEYSLRDDGDIRVTNTCKIEGREDRKRAIGRAWIIDKNTNSKLRVQFFLSGIKLGFLSGNYWILDLSDNYEYVMVGDPSREYFWLLSRSPKMDPELLARLVAKAEVLGFDSQVFIYNNPPNEDTGGV